MAHYFLNNLAQADGDHEMHALGCARMPSDKRYLGNFTSVFDALMEARKEAWQSRGCFACSFTPRVAVTPRSFKRVLQPA